MSPSLQHVLEDKNDWTVSELLRWGKEYLEEKGIESPRLTVELLLAHVLQCSRMDLFLGFEKPLSGPEVRRFRELFERRLNREPLQYIVGEAHFMGLVFEIDARVLIPRPETEILVERAIDLLRAFPDRPPATLLDIGTGSGNISVSIAHFQENVEITAIDVSDDALNVARKNAARHKVGDRIAFRRVDVFRQGSSDDLPDHYFDCILSNPPYIARDGANALAPEIIRFEPEVAVFGGETGLRFFRQIAEVGKRLLKKNGWVIVETAYDQGAAVKAIFAEARYGAVQIFKDYEGNDRVVQSQWNSPA